MPISNRLQFGDDGSSAKPSTYHLTHDLHRDISLFPCNRPFWGLDLEELMAKLCLNSLNRMHRSSLIYKRVRILHRFSSMIWVIIYSTDHKVLKIFILGIFDFVETVLECHRDSRLYTWAIVEYRFKGSANKDTFYIPVFICVMAISGSSC